MRKIDTAAKFTGMWKAVNYSNYPLDIEKMKPACNGRETRRVTQENLLEPTTLNTFIGNATRIWNKAPCTIKNVKTIGAAKKEIKKYCKTLPI